jgi:hypothetical protein
LDWTGKGGSTDHIIIDPDIQYKKTIDLIRFKMKITALNDQREPASGQGETKKPKC